MLGSGLIIIRLSLHLGAVQCMHSGPGKECSGIDCNQGSSPGTGPWVHPSAVAATLKFPGFATIRDELGRVPFLATLRVSFSISRHGKVQEQFSHGSRRSRSASPLAMYSRRRCRVLLKYICRPLSFTSFYTFVYLICRCCCCCNTRHTTE